MNEVVVGFCPMGCGKTLFLGAGGHITCSFNLCPDPAAVDKMLSNPSPAINQKSEYVK